MSMSRGIDTGTELPAGREEGLKRALLAAVAVGVVLLLGAAIFLWQQHGTALFFDTLAAGIAACF
ncbi:hypothetical protein ABLE91_22675 [Aquabacter sp. CN5-332]|uniref:hypothetical protein n=1 Tax=Aquabacter sp. CN5-332 TaxID=3156608 RepID=UPI0032B4ACED